MNTLSKNEEALRLKLYSTGLNDREIGEAVGKASTTIAGWRHRRQLPANYKPIFEPKTPKREQFEYLLGVIHGDGCVRCCRRSGSIYVPISMKDSSYKDTLKKIFEDAYGLKPLELIHNNCYYLVVNSIKIAEEFLKYKSEGRWIIPKLDYPNEYLAGLWDTDGRIYYQERKLGTTTFAERRICLYQKAGGNLRSIISILKNLGFDFSLKTYAYKNKLGTFKTDVLRILASHYHFFASMIPIKHPRKAIALQKIIEHKRRWKNQFKSGLSMSSKQKNQINILRMSGATFKEIANRLGYCPDTLRRHATFVDKEHEHVIRGMKRKRVFLTLEGPKTSTQISRRLEANPKGVQKALWELKLKGLVAHSADKIKRVYCLTEAGRKVFETIKSARANLEISPQEVGESSPQKLGV